ncbi:(Fe-S)-binding protein [candidate division KSB1 bacterium]|nr:(Fe-S)-binding protein [candidate division KSB1 bacterium]
MNDQKKRVNVKGKKVSLFVTCLIDSLFPEIGVATVKILRRLGIDVDFPMKQTCCGQPAYNAGYRKDALSVAERFLYTFAGSEIIVTPSGSCAAMVKHEYPVLFKNDSKNYQRALEIAEKTWELSSFIVDGLGVEKMDGKLSEPCHVAFHDSCHGLRHLKLGPQVRKLISGIQNVEISELNDSDSCCGFGGLFSVKMADVSGAMLQKKIDNIISCKADTILLGDSSCMMNIQGGLKKQGYTKKVTHFALILAEAISNENTI